MKQWYMKKVGSKDALCSSDIIPPTNTCAPLWRNSHSWPKLRTLIPLRYSRRVSASVISRDRSPRFLTSVEPSTTQLAKGPLSTRPFPVPRKSGVHRTELVGLESRESSRKSRYGRAWIWPLLASIRASSYLQSANTCLKGILFWLSKYAFFFIKD